MPSPTASSHLSIAARSSRTASRPCLFTTAGRFNTSAVMRLAHQLARDDIADAARRGRVRRYKVALRDALTSAWSTAQSQRYCVQRDVATAALPVSHAAILAERTSALMVDSTCRMVAELSAIDARAAALGLRL